MKALGQVYTPSFLSKIIIDKFIIDIEPSMRFLEPSMGKGSFYFSLIELLLSKGFTLTKIVEEMVWGVELDSNNFEEVKTLLLSEWGYEVNEKTKIFNEDYLLLNFSGFKFDYIIGNPPYVSYKNILPTKGTKSEYMNYLVDKWKTDKVSDLYLYFYLKGLSELNEDGRFIFLCSDTWINSKYGNSLKLKFKEQFSLTTIVSSPFTQFFSEDTNAIITVIDHKKDKPCEIYWDGFSNDTKMFVSKTWLNDALDKRLRNVILIYPYFWETYNLIHLKNNLKDFIKITPNKLGFNDIKTDVGDCKIFYQDQSRVGKPAIYRNNIYLKDLKYSVDQKWESYKVKDILFASTMVDRLPLIFWVKSEEVIPTSKYWSFESKIQNLTDFRLIYFLFINPLTLIDFEIKSKESTKRSKRIGECGFAKETDQKTLENLICFDYTKIKDSTQKLMIDYLNKWEDTIEFNIENIFKRNDYRDIIEKIHNDCGLKFEFDIFEFCLMLYRKRMRNIAYRHIN